MLDATLGAMPQEQQVVVWHLVYTTCQGGVILVAWVWEGRWRGGAWVGMGHLTDLPHIAPALGALPASDIPQQQVHVPAIWRMKTHQGPIHKIQVFVGVRVYLISRIQEEDLLDQAVNKVQEPEVPWVHQGKVSGIMRACSLQPRKYFAQLQLTTVSFLWGRGTSKGTWICRWCQEREICRS